MQRNINNYAKEFEYVKNMFDECIDHNRRYGFRNKLEHTKRVCLWANRLLKHEKADTAVLLTAAIFHDVGYIYSAIEHPKYSAEICKQYLKSNNYDNDFIEKVVDIIANHGNKELLFKAGTCKEQILLIEADCLDESGAMSILRDAISEGKVENNSYVGTYERLLERSIIKNPSEFYCVTDAAKKYWMEKQKLCFNFINSLKEDLVGFEELIIG